MGGKDRTGTDTVEGSEPGPIFSFTIQRMHSEIILSVKGGFLIYTLSTAYQASLKKPIPSIILQYFS